jgi:hypothetical protein
MIAMRKAALATAGVVAVGGLVFGAASAFASSPTSSPTASASSTSSAAAKKHDGARKGLALHRKQLLKNGAHGQNTVKDKSGQWVVHEWQVGKVGSVNGSTVTVTDKSGTTWTWTVVSGAKVRVSGKASSLSAVKTGDTIVLTGVQSGSANDARVIVDPDQSKLG